jgi:hypothetical protein
MRVPLHLAVLTALVPLTIATARPANAQSRTTPSSVRDSAAKRPAAADTADDDDEDSGSPVRYGIAGRSSAFQDGHSEYGGGIVLAYVPKSWLTLSLNPSYTLSTDPKGKTTAGQFNFSSVPIEIDGSHEFGGALHPELGLSLGAELPVSRASDSAATSQTAYSIGLGASITPVPNVHLSADASRDLSGATARAALALASATSVGAGISVDAGSRLTLSGGISGDVGTITAGDTAARSVGASAAYRLAGPLTLTVDGSHRLQGDTPTWTASVGIGTAFAGVATIGPASALSRMGHAAHALKAHGRGSAKKVG